ncbi:Hsp20/alpha crystallin family protein [Nocardioides panacis]|uniref:Hsp20/alpha crystallin family protein n=1 Tax=Nocardioides panacis TaxID=2849501 RepID=A0A975SWD6_9ACTN|nr:Hsp20/alpha crystallin family protein [Nocardioides panacis]QWZ06690.1 Hsp20/alpha crystallin family protein [Nocardioides panacis]
MATLARRTSNTWGDMLDWIESGPALGFQGLSHTIRVEDYEEDGTYVLRAEMPGIDPDKDVEVGVSGDVLTISGRRQEEERDKNHSEFRYGSFSRSLRLPPGSDRSSIAATYENGVLEVRVPVGDARAEVTKVPVQRSGS